MKNQPRIHPLGSVFLTLILTFCLWSQAQASQPTVLKSVGDRLLPTNASSLSIDLTQYVKADAATNLVRVTTSLTGSNGIPLGFTLQLFPSNAPQTVANFLAYVNDGAYENMLIHRSVPGFVIQTGGYDYSGGSIATWTNIVPSEYGLPNTRGTVAMALVGTNANSATDQWFVNLADNRPILDSTNTQHNPPFTVFAQVLGNGMTTVDAIAGLPIYRNLNAPFNELPLLSTNTTPPLTLTNLVHISRVATIPYFALSSDSAAYAPRISNSTLYIDYTGGTNPPTNPVTISLFATDTNGLSTNTSFLVWHLTNQVRSILYPTNADQPYSTNGFDMAFYPRTSDGTPLPVSGITWNTNLARFQGYTNGYNHFSILGTGTITFTYVQPENVFYRAATNSTSFVISKAPQTITFAGSSGTVVFSTNPYTLTNLPSSSSTLPVSLSIAPDSPAHWKTNSQLLFTGAGTVTLVANQSGNSNYLAASPVTSTLVVSRAPQTITFQQQITNQILTLQNLTPLIPLKAVTTSGLRVQYRVASGNDKGTITNVVSSNKNGSTTNAFLQVTGSGTVSVEAYIKESENYLAADSVTNTITSKLAQKLNPFGKIPAKTFTYPYTSFTVSIPSTDALTPTAKNVVLTAVPSNIATVTNNSLVTLTGAGTVTLTATQAGDDFYFPASVSTSFVVAKAPQTITAFPPIPAKTNGIASFPITVPVASSALPVTITASGAGYASTNGTNVMISLSNSGKVTVTATQSGNANYLPAKAVSTTFSVAKGNQSINFPSIDTYHFFSQTFPLQATAVPSGLPINYKIISGINAARLISTNGGTSVNITAPTGTVTIVASQAGNSGYNAAASKTNSFTITAP